MFRWLFPFASNKQIQEESAQIFFSGRILRHKKTCQAYNNMGVIFKEQENLEKAMERFQRKNGGLVNGREEKRD